MRVEFLTTLDVRKLEGRDWLLLAPFVVAVDGEAIKVPAGYVTDFASVPRWPLAFMLTGGLGEKSATVHDWLYEIKAGRDYADNVLRALLIAEGEPEWRARAMYAGVRVGGEARYGERVPAPPPLPADPRESELPL